MLRPHPSLLRGIEPLRVVSEDRRLFVPAPIPHKSKRYVPDYLLKSGDNRSRPTRYGGASRLTFVSAFNDPKVRLCLRRKVRREVLFAKGRSGSGFRRPRWNYLSRVRC